MTTTLSVILGGAGVILLLVGLVGGGFTFSGSVMPTVGRAPRIACFMTGSVLLVLALFIGLAEIGSTIPQTQPDPPTPATTDPSTSSSATYASVFLPAGQAAFIYADPVSTATTVGQVNAGVSIGLICSTQGEYVVNFQNTGSTLWYRTETGYIPDVNLNTGTTNSVTPTC